MPRERFVEVDDSVRLKVFEWGDAAGWPVVVLHGGAHHAGHWAGVCEQMPASLRCIVPDQRGHGHSDWAPDGDYSCRADVEDLARLLDALGVERCALVGHSMGGLNALEFAGLFPERARALALIDVGTETAKTGMDRVRARVAGSRDAPPPPTTRPDEAIAFDRRLMAFVPTYCGNAAYRRRLLLDAAAPLLVVRGEHSRILSREGARETAALVSGRVAEIPDAGHAVSVDNPAAVADALTKFLEPLAVS